jgi:hypothetical protein
MHSWTTGARRRIAVGGMLAFALFSLLAQRSVGLGMTVSPFVLAANQPLALLQAVTGCLLGALVGARLGYDVGRQLTLTAGEGRDPRAWLSVLNWTVPWGLVIVMNLDGYRPSYGEPAWMESLLRQIFPLTLGFKQAFLFALAAGYAVGSRSRRGS